MKYWEMNEVFFIIKYLTKTKNYNFIHIGYNFKSRKLIKFNIPDDFSSLEHML